MSCKYVNIFGKVRMKHLLPGSAQPGFHDVVSTPLLLLRPRCRLVLHSCKLGSRAPGWGGPEAPSLTPQLRRKAAGRGGRVRTFTWGRPGWGVSTLHTEGRPSAARCRPWPPSTAVRAVRRWGMRSRRPAGPFSRPGPLGSPPRTRRVAGFPAPSGRFKGRGAGRRDACGSVLRALRGRRGSRTATGTASSGTAGAWARRAA